MIKKTRQARCYLHGGRARIIDCEVHQRTGPGRADYDYQRGRYKSRKVK